MLLLFQIIVGVGVAVHILVGRDSSSVMVIIFFLCDTGSAVFHKSTCAFYNLQMTDTSDDGAFMVMYGANGCGRLYVLSHLCFERGKCYERKRKKSENRVPHVAVSIPNASQVTK